VAEINYSTLGSTQHTAPKVDGLTTCLNRILAMIEMSDKSISRLDRIGDTIAGNSVGRAQEVKEVNPPSSHALFTANRIENLLRGHFELLDQSTNRIEQSLS
jgi:hypothetical protein